MSLKFFNITAINTGSGEFSFETVHDLSGLFSIGEIMQVRASTGNDGFYEIASSSYSGITTTVEVVEPIIDGTVDGTTNLGVMNLEFSDPSAKANMLIAPFDANNDLSITIPGIGSTNYAQALMTNQLHMLENFAGVLPPINPTLGQQWFDVSTDSIKAFTSTGWSSSIYVGSDNIVFADPQNGNTEIFMSGDDDVSPDVGITIRPAVNPASGESLFRVIDSFGVEALRVEFDGALTTSNSLGVIGTINPNYIAGSLVVGDTTITPGYDLDVRGSSRLTGNVVVGGVMTLNANIDANGNKIINAADPTNPQDYSTKHYADTELAAAVALVLDGTMPAQTSIPVARVGALDGTPIPITWNANSFVLTVTSTFNAFVNGREVEILPSVIDVEVQEGTGPAQNTTFYLNIEVVGAVATFTATLTKPPLTFDVVTFGEMQTDAVGFLSGTIESVTRLGTYITADVPTPDAIVRADSAGVIDPGWWVLESTVDALATTYTLTASDHNKHKVFEQECIVTVPDDSVDLPIGTEISFRQGSDVVSFVAAGGVVIDSLNGELLMSGTNARATLIKESANSWFLFGDIGPSTTVSPAAPSGGEEGDFWVETTP